MATNATQPAHEKTVTPTAALSTPERRAPQSSARHAGTTVEKKLAGYGLPCSLCHAYYPSDMQACPVCKCPDRVSPTAPVTLATVAIAPAPATKIDSERERLLKELKSEAFATHTQINAPATFRCVLSHQHSGASEPAAVCHTCYSEVRQQADRMEAALHLDVKEAAKIVYDAVWADTSDPNASYFNAARALMSELRHRAGIGMLLSTHKPLAH
jgi:hypothetical protein